MKKLFFILFTVILFLSCSKEAFEPMDTAATEVEATITNEFMKLILSEDVIPIEVFQEYATGEMINLQDNSQRASCAVSWGQTCGSVIFTSHPNFAYVLNWTENDRNEELLYFSPDTACVISSLPSQSIVGSFVVLIDFGGGIIKPFKIYRFIPANAPVGEYRVIVKDQCSCNGEIRIGIKIHEENDPAG